MAGAVAYVPEEHFDMMGEWLKLRGKPPLKRELLPKTGFIVPGVAACFLYLTDSRLGLLENVVANPSATKEDREKAFSEIASAIVQKAKTLGVHTLMAFTAIQSIQKSVLASGAVPMAHDLTMYMKEI